MDLLLSTPPSFDLHTIRKLFLCRAQSIYLHCLFAHPGGSNGAAWPVWILARLSLSCSALVPAPQLQHCICSFQDFDVAPLNLIFHPDILISSSISSFISVFTRRNRSSISILPFSGLPGHTSCSGDPLFGLHTKISCCCPRFA